MFVGGVTIFSIYVVFFPLIFSFPHQRLLFVHLYSSCAFSIFSGSLLVSLSCISSSASHAWSVSRTIWSADQKQFSSYSFTLNPFVPSQVHEGHILGKQQRFLKRWCFFVLLNSFGPSVYYIPLCFRGCINIKIGESLFYDFFFLYLSVVLWLLAGVTGYWSLVVAARSRERTREFGGRDRSWLCAGWLWEGARQGDLTRGRKGHEAAAKRKECRYWVGYSLKKNQGKSQKVVGQRRDSKLENKLILKTSEHTWATEQS